MQNVYSFVRVMRKFCQAFSLSFSSSYLLLPSLFFLIDLNLILTACSSSFITIIIIIILNFLCSVNYVISSFSLLLSPLSFLIIVMTITYSKQLTGQCEKRRHWKMRMMRRKAKKDETENKVNRSLLAYFLSAIYHVFCLFYLL